MKRAKGGKFELDAKDERMIRILSADARIPGGKLADLMGMKYSSTIDRRKALEEAGVIKSYTVIVDWDLVADPDDLRKGCDTECF